MEISRRINSPNFISTIKPRDIKFIILHFTEVPIDKAMELLTTKEGGVSCHYLIHKNGGIDSIVPDADIALHAGRGSWKNHHEINDISIGIEIDNSGREKFGEDQMKSVIELCGTLSEKYNIPRGNILGHSDIAPSRKLDPGIYFDWVLLAENNLGIDFEKPSKSQNEILYNFGDKGPEIEELQEALSEFGYRIYITGIFDKQTNEVIRAFQSHFCPEVIFDKGGDGFYNNPDSIFVWDEASERLLNKLTTRQTNAN